jgi:hypothetical protein
MLVQSVCQIIGKHVLLERRRLLVVFCVKTFTHYCEREVHLT